MPDARPMPEFEALLEKVRKARNFDFRNYKRATLQRRIEQRLQERNCADVAAYELLLEREPAEFDALISRLLIKVTSFFRDPTVWASLSHRVVPQLIAEKGGQEEVRIWSAGCATGEEAFSVAILVAEALGPAFAQFPLKVFGTDVDDAAVAHARRGIYSADRLEGMPKPLLAKYFVAVPEGYAVTKEIRRTVVFGSNNLVTDAPISRLDLILCRNVFIYLDNLLQKRVLTRFHYALRDRGVLLLGKSELIPFAAKIFEPIDLSARLYAKDSRRDVPHAAQERLVGLLEQENIARHVGQSNEDLSVVGRFYRDVLDSSSLPLIATGLDGSVALWSQAAARLWGRAESEVLGKKLATLGLPGLSGDLLIEKTTAVREGLRDRESADAMLAAGAHSQGVSIRVEVTALRDSTRETVGLLYVVEDRTVQRTLEGDIRRSNAELAGAHDRLQQTVEELRSANEELETTNEELQSANEELQSTNEELETTNEELQSTNAELDATNRELAHRTEEMHLLAFYQRTIIRSLSAGVVVLDMHGRITSWNLAAERLLGLPEREAIGQLLWSLRVPALRAAHLLAIRKALAGGRALRREEVVYTLPGGGIGYATIAAIPLTEDDSALGAVILFEDTTRTVRLVREHEPKKAPTQPKPVRAAKRAKPKPRR
jgi:two-component system CheB/CheR fusion protein